MCWVGATRARRPFSFSGPAQGATASPERSTPNPGRRLDAAGGPNLCRGGTQPPPRLAVPGPLAPGRNPASTTLLPTVTIGDVTAWSPRWRTGPGPGGSCSRCASPRTTRSRRSRRRRAFMRRAGAVTSGPGILRPAGLSFGAAVPPAHSHSPAGAVTTIPRATCKGPTMSSC